MNKDQEFQFRQQRLRLSNQVNVQLNQLSKCDNYHGIFALLIDWGFIILAFLISNHISFYFYPLSLLLIGSRQRALATLLHEATHNCIAKNRYLNYAIGTFFSGYWIFQSFNAYKQSHIEGHHGSLGDKSKDPDYQYYLSQGLYKGINQKQFLRTYVLLPLFCLKAIPYVQYLFKERLISFYKFRKEAVLFLLFWIATYSLLFRFQLFHLFLLYWIIPYLTVFVIIGHFIEIAEHFPLVGNSDHPIEMTRNRFSHWLEAFFLSIHNENYHLTHHLRPKIPFWNLKKAHDILMQDPMYSKVNNNFGGIFLSSKKDRIALIPGLISGRITLPHPF